MIYQNIILTIWILITLLMLWASLPHKKDIDRMRAEQESHYEYQKQINDQSIKLHEKMLSALLRIDLTH